MASIFAKEYKSIIIARKFLGMWWETTSVPVMPGDDHVKLFQITKDIYFRKWGKKNVRFRLWYGEETYTWQ